MEQQRKRQRHQLITVICVTLISLNGIAIAMPDNDASYNDDNDALFDGHSNYSANGGVVSANYDANERYSVLRLRTDDAAQFSSIRELIDRSVDLKVSI